jgi:hypothetical protein
MRNKTEITARLAFWRDALAKLQAAYLALLDGGVKSYTIDDRQLTKLDIPDLLKQIKAAEKMINELEALLRGQGRRKAVGVVPRDW